MTTNEMTRRTFMGNMAMAGTLATVVPRHVLGGPGYQAPSDTVNIAGIGVGGVGSGKVGAVNSQNIVALCDIDDDYAASTFNDYPDAARYKDYRRMLDEEGDQIDGVIIATPDHTHAVIALEAMRRGKHVYVEKPLTWSIEEARLLGDAARQTGVVAQMGNQGHSMDDARKVNEYIEDGAIGEVREVHVWTNRPLWPQGMDAPEVLRRKPDTLDWDLFLGPAREVPYDPAYHPWNWRGWVDWGTGALGDMGAHLIDHPIWALDLPAPATIETRSTAFNQVSWPQATTTYFEFSEQELSMIWYDGGLRPARPEELGDDDDLNPGGGVLYVGSEGKLMHDTYGSNPRLLPEELHNDYGDPPETYPRIQDEAHEMNWVRAIRGEEELSQDFDHAVHMTEMMLLGIVSLRAGNRRIEWDAESMEVTNITEANEFLAREPRSGWELPSV